MAEGNYMKARRLRLYPWLLARCLTIAVAIILTAAIVGR